MNRKLMGLVLAMACAAVLLASVNEMVRRVSTFHKQSGHETYVFSRIGVRSFSYADRPVTIEDDVDENDQRFVVVRYGDETLRLPVTIPGIEGLPGLGRYENWLAVLRFAPLSGRTVQQLQQDIETGSVRDRLAIVTRTPRPGSESGSWSEVWRHDWIFDLYEFMPDGSIEHDRRRFPVSKGYGRSAGSDDWGVEELAEGSWQFQAALFVMPKTRSPKYTYIDDGRASMGWTLPVASLSSLGLIAAIIIAFAPRRNDNAPAAG
jgi:hypothetical protein